MSLLDRFRRTPPPVAVAAGEKVLAWASAGDGVVAGTRDALYLPTARVPWEQVEGADWDHEAGVLSLREIGSWGRPKPVHTFVLADARLLLELVRERVSASIVLQRHVPVVGKAGLRVIARRPPAGDHALTWLLQYDDGIDPSDPEVEAVAARALASARGEVGDA